VAARLVIAYSLIAILVVLAAGGIAWMLYHSRGNKLRRWRREQDRDEEIVRTRSKKE
jgi:uncharacterized membrane protein YqjE